MNKNSISVQLLSRLRLSLIDYYLITELSYFFCLSVGLFSSLGVAVGTLSDLAHKVTEYNLPIALAIQVFFLKIPEFIAYALPISVLLTSLVTYGRLSKDSEIVAFRSVGISSYRLVIPAIWFSLIVIFVTFVFNEIVVPVANYQATVIQEKFIPETKSSLQKKDIYYPEYQSNQLKRLFYAEKFNSKKLEKIIVINFVQGKINQIVTANSAQWNPQQKIWDCFDGKIEYFDEDLPQQRSEQFTEQKFPFSPTIFKLVNQERNPEEMNIRQAINYLNLLKITDNDKKITFFRVRIQQKIAFPFICLVFAAIGSTLGLSNQNIGQAKSFGLTALIVFAYYLLSFLINALGLIGIISPFLAGWSPNFIGLGLALGLLRKSS